MAAHSVAAKAGPPTLPRISAARASCWRSISQRGLSGNRNQQQGEEHRGREAGGEHPAPAGVDEPGLVLRQRGVALGVGDEVVDERGGRDAADDRDLVDRYQAPAQMGRRDLGDIHRRRDGRDADAHAADEAEEDEEANVVGQRRAEGRDEEHQRREEHRQLAPEAVGDRADEQHARGAADEHATGRPALHEIAQAELGGQRFDCSGDNPRVVAEEQSPQRGYQANGDEVGKVRANGRRRWIGGRGGNWHGPHFLRQRPARQWLCATARDGASRHCPRSAAVPSRSMSARGWVSKYSGDLA